MYFPEALSGTNKRVLMSLVPEPCNTICHSDRRAVRSPAVPLGEHINENDGVPSMSGCNPSITPFNSHHRHQAILGT